MKTVKYGEMPHARKQRVGSVKMKVKFKGIVPLKNLMQGKLKIK